MGSRFVQQTVVPGATVIAEGSYLEAVMLIIVSPAGHGPGAAVFATPTSRPAQIALSSDSTASAFTVRTTGSRPERIPAPYGVKLGSAQSRTKAL
jgi:hypothetical protein